ncbi:MAG: rhodanese-like domain-containing protein [Clostridiaceae bacterium]|nr:rhodanese-like domain-containing protein [Clostridiaceae bacterium]
MEKGAFIIDVRTPSEYEELHIKGSINIPVDQIKDRLVEVVQNYGAKIIFYCSKGVRSQTALEEALELGFENVYNLRSINDWPYEKVSGKE